MQDIINFFVSLYNTVATFFVDLYEEFVRVMIDGNRFDFILDGLKNTFLITLGSLALGVVIGVFVAAVRTSFDKNQETLKSKGGFSYI